MIKEEVRSEIERVDRIYRAHVLKMDADIDYARAKVVEKGLAPLGISPDHLSLRNMIDFLGGNQCIHRRRYTGGDVSGQTRINGDCGTG